MGCNMRNVKMSEEQMKRFIRNNLRDSAIAILVPSFLGLIAVFLIVIGVIPV